MNSADTLRGVIPILAMPFRPDGLIDEEALRHEVDWAIGHGVHGLGLALASEMLRLTEAERARVTALAVEAAGGRVPVVVHASAESSFLASELSRRAEAEGASALMVTPPTFQVGGAQRMVVFFRELAQATTVPIVLQDVVTARVDMGLTHTLQREFPGRILLKAEVPPTPFAVATAVAATNGQMPVFGGAGGLAFYSELLRGAAGTMPSCMVPEPFVEVWDKYQDGDVEGARLAFARLQPLLVLTTSQVLGLAYYREALVLRGIFESASCRAPSAVLSDLDRRELQVLLDSLELETVR
jgi:dihydrodipicolinate synthase/N-acetylneuraminate lyase